MTSGPIPSPGRVVNRNVFIKMSIDNVSWQTCNAEN
jgi:hypothetical protein